MASFSCSFGPITTLAMERDRGTGTGAVAGTGVFFVVGGLRMFSCAVGSDVVAVWDRRRGDGVVLRGGWCGVTGGIRV